MMALCDIQVMGGSAPGSGTPPDSSKEARLDDKWNAMCEYLDNAAKVNEKFPEKKDGELAGKKAVFAGGSIAALVVFLIGPIAGFSLAGATPAEALPWVAAIALFGGGTCVSALYDATWKSIKRETDSARYREEEKRSWMRRNNLDHDNGDNDLDEIRLIAKSLLNIDGNLSYAAALASRKGLEDGALREGKAKGFYDTSRKYIVLSFWDGHEKKISDGFERIVMGASAAWKAYLELIDEGVEDDYLAVAQANIDKVFDHANKIAYRNFSKIDAKLHGEEHIFDLPDAPEVLSNMAKLSIAASMFDDEE